MTRYVVRRLLFVPLMPIGLIVGILATVVAAAVSLIAVPVLSYARHETPRWRFLRVSLAATAYLFVEVLGILACLVLWLTTRGERSVRAHRRLLRVFLGFVLWVFRKCFGFEVALTEPGPSDVLLAKGKEPVVVLARHAGPGASFALIHQLIARYRKDVRVVLKEQLRLDPIIDLLLTRTGCTWIRSHDDGQAEQVGRTAADLRECEALVLFPEGADWTPVRHLQAVARLRRKGLLREARQALRMPHVLPPRPAGTIAALEGAPEAEVLVFTHTGHDELLDASSSWRALPLRKPLQMTWWHATDVPRAGDISAWLQQVWADIDAWIERRQAVTSALLPSTRTDPPHPHPTEPRRRSGRDRLRSG